MTTATAATPTIIMTPISSLDREPGFFGRLVTAMALEMPLAEGVFAARRKGRLAHQAAVAGHYPDAHLSVPYEKPLIGPH